MPSFLESLSNDLNKRRRRRSSPYRVPLRWLAAEGRHSRLVVRHSRLVVKRTASESGAIEVDPFRFYAAVAADLASRPPRPRSPLDTHALQYVAFLRHIMAFDHDGDGRIDPPGGETGTILKGLVLLDHLVRMGVTHLILLPVTPASRAFRKGSLPSPYAAREAVGIDPAYADPLCPDIPLDDFFQGFVEAAHRLGISVLFDVVPRTAARDCDFLLEAPEAFYWIAPEAASNFAPPRFPDLVGGSAPLPEWIERIYRDEATRAFLSRFRPDPGRAEGWPRFVEDARRKALQGEALLDEIARHFGVVVAPAFSDVVNDEQPPWSDVTYLRLYEDPPAAAVPYLPPGQPPYVLHDVAKASRFPGTRPLVKTWERIEGILPEMIRRYDIDGARIDMGHALPEALEGRILAAARAEKPDFLFVAEEFETAQAPRYAEKGYAAFIGNAWWHLPRMDAPEYEAWRESLEDLPLPFWATPETPDTPRAAARPGGLDFARRAWRKARALPNGIPTVNGGMELGETDPINTGLDFSPEEAKALSGRLALFHPTAPDWTRPREATLLDEFLPSSSSRSPAGAGAS